MRTPILKRFTYCNDVRHGPGCRGIGSEPYHGQAEVGDLLEQGSLADDPAAVERAVPVLHDDLRELLRSLHMRMPVAGPSMYLGDRGCLELVRRVLRAAEGDA